MGQTMPDAQKNVYAQIVTCVNLAVDANQEAPQTRAPKRKKAALRRPLNLLTSL
jgi:hypothetical protein